MSTVIRHPINAAGFRLFTKGASEIILKKLVLSAFTLNVYLGLNGNQVVVRNLCELVSSVTIVWRL